MSRENLFFGDIGQDS